MNRENYYDCGIIGGGLGGLTLAINLSKKGHRIILFEKEQYPFHKVCGEYISMESWDYLLSLGLPLDKMNVARINKLRVSAPDGNILSHDLFLGGFGISRYTLDNELKKIAVQCGVTVMDKCKVDHVEFAGDSFIISGTNGKFECRVCCGSFGKRSNIDIKFKRAFTRQKLNKLNNFIAVKYHINYFGTVDTIALHNFKDGYCGISGIEDGKYCVCYLTKAGSLKANNNSIPEMEKNLLCTNPHLKEIFENSSSIYPAPLSISRISFDQKKAVERHILMIGDSAGMITPLCGNGMSMAMHAGKIASGYITSFLDKKINRLNLEESYAREWKKTFGKRLWIGRMIQGFFGNSQITNLFISTMKKLPWLTGKLIRQTHGKPF